MPYGTSTHQKQLTCIDCHMPDMADNGGAPNHSFYAQLSACQSCHVGAKGFDINGGQSLITAALFELQAALNTAGFLTRSAAPPYMPLQAADLADGAFQTDKAKNPPATDAGPAVVTADQAGAVYNYFIVARGGALGAHNPCYTQQLLFDSYKAITNNPPTSIRRPAANDCPTR
jgi:hypothetical protein